VNAICVTCGTQFAETSAWPDRCLICDEERQYIGLGGQRWTTFADLCSNYKAMLEAPEPDLLSFAIDGKFGIGQRAFLIRTSRGNLLWDCISLLNDEMKKRIREFGGLAGICISHPHYYTTMVEWSRAFGNAPIYLHQDDAEWVARPDSVVQFWTGETKALDGGLTVIRCGGHFQGASVLHWPEGCERRGALLSGDTIQVCPDRRSVSFMYSYPNYIPLDATRVRRIVSSVESFAFDRIYGAFPHMTIPRAAKDVIARSTERYLRFIGAQRAARG
jgi:glyoxylase-like metal-dependent hydrolase (beta-lactamase superfamily II)